MIALSIVALFVYIFGAFVHGSATLLSLRQAAALWAPHRAACVGGYPRVNSVSLALLVVSTLWFVVHVLIEFRVLAGGQGYGNIDFVALLLVFAYPPLIMHTVHLETQVEGDPAEAGTWRGAVGGMYVLSPLVAAWVVAAIAGLVPRPQPLGTFIGLAIAGLFVLTSVYSIAIMLRRKHPGRTRDQARLRTMMLWLFVVMITLFIIELPFQGQPFAAKLFDRLSRATPIVFLLVSVYFENRFEFYDLVIKRGVLLVLSLLVFGTFLVLGLPWLEQLPAGGARPWLFAVALVPVAMIMPWFYMRAERWLDRMWFGREFTPVEAVKHVLAAMQPATDEPSLVAATEHRLTEIFGVPILVLIEHAAPPEGAIVETEIAASSPVSGTPARFVVLRNPGSRTLLSEDIGLLRSLGGVFGFMLENVRLQRRRQEQEQLAQELRLQSSRSELKALRAQINPHFLFNALNAIASLIHTDPARADAAVEQLAEVFRYTLRRSDSEWAPLDQELQFAQAYLDVEQARFGRRLAFTIDADPSAKAAQVPSMLLQTLVENAVKHGISQVRGTGHIDIRAWLADNRLVLEVRDTGPGPARTADRPRRVDGESFGLRSVRDRLQGHFGDRAELTLERDAVHGVTVARIDMPLTEVHA
jgi:two-component sensor histidine kinase